MWRYAAALPSWKPGDAEHASPPAFERVTLGITECRVAERIAATVISAIASGGSGKLSIEESRTHWAHIVESRGVKQLAVDAAAGVSAWRRTVGGCTS